MKIGIVIISILFSILLFGHKPNAYPYDEDFGLLPKYQFNGSNDKRHDSKFVQHYFKL
jgi:hypothetical protein